MVFHFRSFTKEISTMLPKLMLGSLFALAVMAGGVLAAEKAAEPAQKDGDCCARKLACCDKQNACCKAEKKPGCCAKGMKCCAENRACCGANPPACCVKGEACCDGPKDCCGEAGKVAAKKAGKQGASCCMAKKAEKPACCVSAKK